MSTLHRLTLCLAVAVLLSAAPPARPDDAPPPHLGFEVVHGNGGVLFRLAHGGVAAGSLSVRRNGQPLGIDRDFYLDPVSGSITLIEPLDPSASLTVRYAYDPSQDRSGAPFHLSFEPGLMAHLRLSGLYAVSPGGSDLLSGSSQVSGMVLDPRALGFGQLSGLMLMSRKGGSPLDALTRARDGRSSLLSQLTGGGAKANSSSDGDLYQYGLDRIKIGSGTFGVSVRKVGSGFDFAPVAPQFQDGPRKALFDRLQKERGLATLALDGQYGIGKAALSQMLFRRISDDKGSATQQRIGVTGKTFDVSYNSLKVASGFSHLKDADLQEVGDLKAGQERTDMAASFHPWSSLSLQTAATRLIDEKGNRQTTRRIGLDLKPGKRTQISLAQQEAIAQLAQGADAVKREMRQSLSFSHRTQGGIVIQASQDTLHLVDGKRSSIQRTQLFHFETDQKKPTLFLFEKKLDVNTGSLHQSDAEKVKFITHVTRLATVQWSDDFLKVQEKDKLQTSYNRELQAQTDPKKRLNFSFDQHDQKTPDGAAQVLQQIVFAAAPTPALSVKDTDIDQKVGTATTTSNNLEFNARPLPQIDIAGNILSRDSSTDGATDQLNLNLQAHTGNLEVAAEQHDVSDGKAKQESQETDLSLAAPVAAGTSLRGTYVTRRNKGIRDKLMQTLGLDHGIFGGRFVCELGKVRYIQGHPFTTYAAGFTSAKTPKHPLGFTTLYRKMGANDGSEVSEYQYSVDWSVSRRFSFSARQYQNDSVRDGFFYRVTPVRGDGFTMDAELSPRLKLCAGFANETSLGDRKTVRAENLSLKGSLDSATSIDFSYLSYLAEKWKEETPTHWLRLTVKRDLSDQDRLLLTCDARFWHVLDPKTPDKKTVNGQLEYVRTF